MTDKYAVIGNPIAHSKSPQIHKMFAEQTGQDISYEAIEAPLDGFAATVERLRKEGYKGCNVTVPFKKEAWKLSKLTSRALDAQAVNTVEFNNGKVYGDNTDGVGLVNDVESNLKIPLNGKRILLIGAGGAAYGVLHPLLESSQAPLVIYNRTLEKAVSLKKSIEQHEKFRLFAVDAMEFGDLEGEQFDVVINATSAGLKDEMPQLPSKDKIPLNPPFAKGEATVPPFAKGGLGGIFAPGALAYDLMYGRETPFMKFARANGAAIIADGLGMLVEQAAESFFLWRGVRPETSPVIAALRNPQ